MSKHQDKGNGFTHHDKDECVGNDWLDELLGYYQESGQWVDENGHEIETTKQAILKEIERIETEAKLGERKKCQEAVNFLTNNKMDSVKYARELNQLKEKL